MGKLFVIDGTDGSGKQTQFELLKKSLDSDKIKYLTTSFPNYNSPSSSLVKMYLSGEFGEKAKDINAYIASTFYAVDRFATYKKDLEKFYNEGGIILADRYTTANMVHQAGKILDIHEREKFLNWLWELEFELYKIPVPTTVFFLDMPPEYSLKLIENRKNKFTHEEQKDIHERDKSHIIDSYNSACYVAEKYNWYRVQCIENNEIRTIEDIHKEIYKEIKNHIN